MDKKAFRAQIEAKLETALAEFTTAASEKKFKKHIKKASKILIDGLDKPVEEVTVKPVEIEEAKPVKKVKAKKAVEVKLKKVAKKVAVKAAKKVKSPAKTVKAAEPVEK